MRKKRWFLCSLLVLVLLFTAGWKLYPTARRWANELTFDDRAHSPAELTVMAYARDHGLHYRNWPESLIALLDRNPETEDFVLSYPAEHSAAHTVDLSEYDRSQVMPLFLQWDKRWGYLQYGDDVAGLTACGPVCLSMTAFYLTSDPAMSPDNLIRFAIDEGYCSRGNGSSWTLISQGAAKLGLKATELPLVESRITSALEDGKPVICVMGPGDFTSSGHYIVMTGMEDGHIRINDPNSRANSEKLWDYNDIYGQIRNLWMIETQGAA